MPILPDQELFYVGPAHIHNAATVEICWLDNDNMSVLDDNEKYSCKPFLLAVEQNNQTVSLRIDQLSKIFEIFQQTLKSPRVEKPVDKTGLGTPIQDL